MKKNLCFVLTAALLPSALMAVVVYVETVHDALPFSVFEVQIPVSLVLSFSAFPHNY